MKLGAPKKKGRLDIRENFVSHKKQTKSAVLSDSWLRKFAGCNSEVETGEDPENYLPQECGVGIWRRQSTGINRI